MLQLLSACGNPTFLLQQHLHTFVVLCCRPFIVSLGIISIVLG